MNIYIFISLLNSIFLLCVNSIYCNGHPDPTIIYFESNTEQCYELVGKLYSGHYSLEEEKSNIQGGLFYSYDDVNEELYIIAFEEGDKINLTKIQYFKSGKIVFNMKTCKSLLSQNKNVFYHKFRQLKMKYLNFSDEE